MIIFWKSSGIFRRQRDVKNCRWKLPHWRKVRRDYVVGQEFSLLRCIVTKQKGKAFIRWISRLSVLWKKILVLIKQRKCYMINKKQWSSYSPGEKKYSASLKHLVFQKKMFHETSMTLKATKEFLWPLFRLMIAFVSMQIM